MLKHFFGFSSRANRTEYLFLELVLSGIGLGLAYFIPEDVSELMSWVFLLTPLWLPMIWIALTLQIRRLHDFDCSGWWILLVWVAQGMLPGNGILVTLFFLLMPGTDGENRFGSNDRCFYPSWMNQKAVWIAGVVLWGVLLVAKYTQGSAKAALYEEWLQRQEQTYQSTQTQASYPLNRETNFFS